MKLCICNEMFENWKIEDVFECAAELGYKAVELAPFTLADHVRDISKTDRDRIKKSAEKSKVEIAGLHWLLVSPKGLYVNHVDPEIRAETRQFFFDLIDLCADLDGTKMIIGSPKQRSVLEGWDFDECWNYAGETFRESAIYAKDKNVTLCMEPLSSNQTNFINSPADAKKMIDLVDQPNFQMILDVTSTSRENLDMPTQIREFADHVAHFHSNDSNGYLPGSGDVDYPPIIDALKEINFDGYISTEVFNFKPDPVTIARKSIEFLKPLIG